MKKASRPFSGRTLWITRLWKTLAKILTPCNHIMKRLKYQGVAAKKSPGKTVDNFFHNPLWCAAALPQDLLHVPKRGTLSLV